MSLDGGRKRLRPAGAGPRTDDPAIVVLVTAVTSVASVLIALTARSTWHEVSTRPGALLAFVGLAFALELASIDVYGRGGVSMSGIAFVAIGFTFGIGPAMVTALLASLFNYARRGGRLYRAVYSAATWALGAAAGAALYNALGADGWSLPLRVLPALAAGPLYLLANVGLLVTAMSVSELRPAREIWRERFRFLAPYYLANGPLALALVIAYEKLRVTGLFAFSLPAILMLVTIRQYVTKTRVAVEEIREVNESLRDANAELAARNEDLHQLLEFARGLAANSHEREVLVGYVETALSRLTGGRARIRIGGGDGGTPLLAGGTQVGSLSLLETPTFDRERWQRLRGAILPHLATTIESVGLVERLRKTHIDTIAALSRSMEAKDYYTGGHTERVASISVALARRLGFAGADLDAIEVGALLHDIGKIGIPERILHKPAKLDAEEWRVMKEHPVISDYILTEIDLHPVVRQIVRWSHERIDGAGYPDGLEGGTIPLAARIVLVADAFDAMTTDRPYRPARTSAAAMEELRANTGTQFCPVVVETLECLARDEPQLLAVPLRVAVA